MRLVLEVASGPGKGRRIEADVGQTISIGRTKKANVALGDNFMSSTHFAIECRDKSCHVWDLKSRNGTQLNGELITEAELKDGDRLFAGRTDFIARVESAPKEVPVPQRSVARPPASGPIAEKSTPRRKVAKKIEPVVNPQPSVYSEAARSESTAVEPPPIENAPALCIEAKAKPVPAAVTPPESSPAARKKAIPAPALESYEAATPQGRLFHTLSNQPQTVMALLDAVHDGRAFELLRASREEYSPLYSGQQNPALTPYLVRLPPRSDLLKQMIQLGWGNGWGVYLTCPLSLAELRRYFRTSLMVTLPDGTELISRFYDPRFFRRFLETCTVEEAEKFFGPVTAYFMEDERPEILLQFSKDKNTVEKRGHLLSDLA